MITFTVACAGTRIGCVRKSLRKQHEMARTGSRTCSQRDSTHELRICLASTADALGNASALAANAKNTRKRQPKDKDAIVPMMLLLNSFAKQDARGNKLNESTDCSMHASTK